ncbi:MAG: hypothetical protein U1E73_13900 [Planctomycetota bacterium]
MAKRTTRVAGVAAPLFLFAAGLHAQCSSNWLPGDIAGVMDAGGNIGKVLASAPWDPDGPGPAAERLVLAGTFVQAGNRPCANLVSWDPATGTFADLGGGANATIEAVAVLPNGDLVVAGQFTAAGGVAANRIARFDGSAFHALADGLDGAVHALCVQPNGDLVAGGQFHASGAVAVDLVARWDGVSWSPLPGLTGSAAGVRALCQTANGDLVAGGDLANGNIARWNGASWSPLGVGTSAGVWALLPLPNGDLVVGGAFATAGGLSSVGIARWDGAQWSAFPSLGSSAYALLREANGDLVVGGFFTQAGNVYSQHVARWDGAQWQAMYYGLSYGTFGVRTLARIGAHLVAGGDFGQALPNGTARGLARWDGAAWYPLAGEFDSTVTGLIPTRGGDLVALGYFASTPGGLAPRIARQHDGAWGALPTTGLTGSIQGPGIELRNGDLVVSTFGSNYQLERFDGLTWSSLGYAGVRVTALVELPNGDLLVGDAGGGVRVFDGVAWSSLPSPGQVGDFALLPNGHVLATGDLYNLSCFLAEWDGSAWTAVGGPRVGTGSTVLVRHNGDVIVGGFALAVPGASTCTARWDGAQWSAFAGGIPSPAGNPYGVADLAELPNGDLVASGTFASAGGSLVGNIARCDGTAWSELGFGITLTGTFYPAEGIALAVRPDGTLCVGGFFSRAGAGFAPNFARFSSTCPALAVPVATACSAPSGPLALTAAALPWLGGTFRSTATGFATNALGVALVGFHNPAQPLSAYFATAVPGCDLLASPDAIVLALPQNGAARYAFAIPNALPLAQLPLQHQFLQLALTAQGALGPVSSSNGLALLLGLL